MSDVYVHDDCASLAPVAFGTAEECGFHVKTPTVACVNELVVPVRVVCRGVGGGIEVFSLFFASASASDSASVVRVRVRWAAVRYQCNKRFFPSHEVISFLYFVFIMIHKHRLQTGELFSYIKHKSCIRVHVGRK